jgi:hypothetical protein
LGRHDEGAPSVIRGASRAKPDPDRDTLRNEYDFSGADLGVTAARYAQGANVVVIDPDVLDIFRDGVAVNEALRALAPVLRQSRKAARKRRSA